MTVTVKALREALSRCPDNDVIVFNLDVPTGEKDTQARLPLQVIDFTYRSEIGSGKVFLSLETSS